MSRDVHRACRVKGKNTDPGFFCDNADPIQLRNHEGVPSRFSLEFSYQPFAGATPHSPAMASLRPETIPSRPLQLERRSWDQL
jgi:hypothetical protein